MFRITEDGDNHYYRSELHVHKKFLWFWVKWSSLNEYGRIKNMAFTYTDLFDLLKKGRYDWSRGASGNYYFITEPPKIYPNANIYYVESAEKFLDTFAEKLI